MGDVYEGEVAQVGMFPELFRRFDGIIDGLRSLDDVARGPNGDVCSDVLEEIEEQWPILRTLSTFWLGRAGPVSK